jgi:hypothetical protein
VLNLQDRFYALLDAYSDGTEPLENWDTQDLSDLQDIVNAELQDRHYRDLEARGISVLGAFDDFED